MSAVDFGSYISGLVKTLFQAYGVSSERIDLKIESEGIKLGVDQAVPLGLVVHELVSNSLKHAFSDGKRGEVVIRTRRDGEAITLVVADNGIGLPPGFDWRKTQTLGLQLVTVLVEEQLQGTADLDSTKGARYTIHFKAKR